ncbi:hypothetical protein C8J56DRAFT_1028967 [Mycena floridula]|nr:hypothetical protein C8J56DRAFT_1028967 [Mycena floridula]
MESLVHSAQLLQAVTYVNVCSLALLIYDSLLTMDGELRLIWRAKMGFGTSLYFTARYITVLDLPLVVYYSLNRTLSPQGCHILYSFNIWTTVVGIIAAETILLLRTWALWGQSMRVLKVLSIISLAIVVPSVVLMVKYLREIQFSLPPSPTISGCYPLRSSNLIFIVYVLIVFDESVVMFLTLWIGYKRYMGSKNQLVYVLYRDGILYFVYQFFFHLGNVVVMIAAPPELWDLLNTIQRVMHTLLSTRVMLHVRELDSRLGKEDTFAFSSIKFHAVHPDTCRSLDQIERESLDEIGPEDGM